MVYNKTNYSLRMHFSKFITVSQIKENTKIITQQLNKSQIQQHHYSNTQTQEGGNNHYQIRIQNKPNPTPSTTPLTPNHKHHHSALSPLANQHHSSQKYYHPSVKVNSISPLYKDTTSHSPFLRQEKRKYSQNNLQFKLKPTPTNPKNAQEHNNLKIPKRIHKNRNSSCQLEVPLGIDTSPTHEHANGNDVGHAQKGNSEATWNEMSNFHISPQSQNNGFMPNLTKSQACSPKHHYNRKHSDNVNTKKIPSFLTASKHYRKSFDSSNQDKLTIGNFTILRELGVGTFGKVVLAMDKRSGMVCAIKMLAKREIIGDNMVEQVVREVKIQMYLSHPNIVKVYGVFDDLLYVYILIECALDGQLSDYLHKRQSPLSQNEASIWFYQACNAISTMHSSSIIHRDLKPQNIMIHQGIIKICDFGWSVIRGAQLRSTFCGTPLYLCPQLLIGDEYDQSIDIWALGVILYEMLCKQNPFRITCQEQLSKIIDSPIQFNESSPLSQQAKYIISSCLSKKAIDRPNIREILLDAFVLMGKELSEMVR